MDRKNHQRFNKKALLLRQRYGGMFSIVSKAPLRNMEDLSWIYTPGVGAVSSFLKDNVNKTAEYTMKGNSVAVVSDGSAVLGLGNIGPEAALPVMEGKCLIFKKFADIDAIPIVLNTQDTDEIVKTVKNIAPAFGGINLEDISAPKCFEVEDRLRKELDIPVMHDDQHGTAIIVLAGLINALKVVGKKLSKSRIVVNGVGAAGTATIKLLIKAGVKDILALDRRGIIYKEQDLTQHKKEIALITNFKNEKGGLAEALLGADVFIGVSGPNLVAPKMIRKMSKNPIIFALANPVPEIMPDIALKAGARVVATGRSDFSNQLNNALVFPGVFRGALDTKVKNITDQMKIKAAYAIARLIEWPSADRIVPGIFDARLVPVISNIIK